MVPLRSAESRRREIRSALKRMSAITVFVATLALTSPPAAAPTDRPLPPDFPAAQHGGTASTPAAVLPAAGVFAVRLGPDAFRDILNFGDVISTKGIREMNPNQLRPLRTVTVIADRGARAAQTRTAKPRDGPHHPADARGQRLPASCF